MSVLHDFETVHYAIGIGADNYLAWRATAASYGRKPTPAKRAAAYAAGVAGHKGVTFTAIGLRLDTATNHYTFPLASPLAAPAEIDIKAALLAAVYPVPVEFIGDASERRGWGRSYNTLRTKCRALKLGRNGPHLVEHCRVSNPVYLPYNGIIDGAAVIHQILANNYATLADIRAIEAALSLPTRKQKAAIAAVQAKRLDRDAAAAPKVKGWEFKLHPDHPVRRAAQARVNYLATRHTECKQMLAAQPPKISASGLSKRIRGTGCYQRWARVNSTGDTRYDISDEALYYRSYCKNKLHEMRAPDHFGHKQFNYIIDADGQVFLRSPHQSTIWNSETLIAPHFNPSPECRNTAGIHSYFAYDIPRQDSIYALVERFGAYVVGTDGWRAETVTIREIYLSPTYHKIAEALAVTYPNAKIIKRS